ncbi:SDR family NAD(P)-dependent oxidoreductase [Paraburkholderia sp. BCC1884]|uniref:SDR family NAD(P)-dependent oxidoreductase n=1 Tax=Paraburkholderia sp. BCC1884 TaxID=2562668 RepID=UPI001183FA61|nr:SDR family NAD(P)-dependent oxidoreductase [Paraburkholderia sp. BCC1884]
MSRIFITGSADGLGQMAARLLVDAGHQVVLHARSAQRAEQALQAIPQAQTALVADLSGLAAMFDLAQQVNRLGRFDAVIHNAAVGYQEPRKITTADGLPHVFAVNTLAPYVLSALIDKPQRLVYLSSGLHRSGDASLDDLAWERRPWQGTAAYSDSKLHDALLAFALARRWPEVLSNALEPGWVATKMGGASAPDDLQAAPTTQVWLAASDDPAARVSGAYFYHMKPRETHPAVRDVSVQERLIEACEGFSGIGLPD